MRVPSGRLKAVLVATLATIILVGIMAPAGTLAKDPPGLARFMAAIGTVESHGDYHARNRSSGAYGKYQIMPASWRAWAARYLGSPDAKPTPANQEIVAASRFRALYAGLGSWRRVAYSWLTGSSRNDGWSSIASRYVTRVMTAYRDRVGTKVTPRRRDHELAPALLGEEREHRLQRDVEVRELPALCGRRGEVRHRGRRHGHLHVHRQQGHLVRPGRPDPRQGQGPDRRRLRDDGRPARLVVHRANGGLQQELVDRRIAHPRHRGRRDGRPPIRRDRRTRGDG